MKRSRNSRAAVAGGVLIVGLVLASCGESFEDRLRPGAPLESFTSHLDMLVKERLGRYDVPGASIAIVRNGEVRWSQGYGLADRETQRPMARDTVFQVASISKSFTAWGVMTLVEEGHVDLDAPIGDYVTRWRFPPSKFDPAQVTVRRLLSHSAGLPLAILEKETAGQPEVTPEGLLTRAGVRLVREPGSGFEYANPGFVLLQLLVEEVTGTRFPDYMQDAVLDPLGMESSSFDWLPELRPRTATGYLPDGEPADDYVLVAKAAGGLYSTAPDLARFVAAQAPGPDGEPAGRGVLQPESVSLLHTPAIATTGLMALASDGYGFGFLVERVPTGARAVMHGGQNAGWITQFFAVPAIGDGIVILTNSQRSQHFVADVAAAWSWWAGFESVKMARSYARIGSALRLVCVGLLVLSAVFVWRIYSGIARGSRRVVLRPRPAAGRRLLKIGLGIGLFVAWGLGRGTVAHLFPALSDWIQLSVALAGAVLILSAAIPFATSPPTVSSAKDSR